MSTVITLSSGGGASETIHGTLQGAIDYLTMMAGANYDAWNALATDDARKKCLATAVRYLNRQSWNDLAATFALRDAIPAFATAEYELAAIAAAKPDALAAIQQGSNIKTAYADGAGTEFFAPSSATAKLIPDVAYNLVGVYLGTTGVAAYGQASCSDSAFEDSDEFNLVWPH